MLIIGIARGSFSKTTVVNQILNKLLEKEVSIIPQDSCYKDITHYKWHY